MLLDDCYASFINLDHRKDRLNQMVKELVAQGIKAVRTRAFTPNDYQGDPSRVQKMMQTTPGAVGCYLSEVKIMRDALASGKHAFVLEDDVYFCPDFHTRLEWIERFTSTHEWDIIWLFACFHINPPYWHLKDLGRDAETTEDPRMIRTFGTFSTGAYIVNRASISKIIDMLDSVLEITIGIDYSFIQLQPYLLTFAFVPGCTLQRDGISDIGGKGVRRNNFSGFKKLGPYVYKDRMQDFDPTQFNWCEAQSKTPYAYPI